MSTELRASMGVRLKEERNRLDLSQDELGQLCDVKRRTLQDWERGVNAPSAEFLALANSHGVDALYILTGERTPTVSAAELLLTQDEAQLLNNYRKSHEEGRLAARVVISALATSA